MNKAESEDIPKIASSIKRVTIIKSRVSSNLLSRLINDNPMLESIHIQGKLSEKNENTELVPPQRRGKRNYLENLLDLNLNLDIGIIEVVKLLTLTPKLRNLKLKNTTPCEEYQFINLVPDMNLSNLISLETSNNGLLLDQFIMLLWASQANLRGLNLDNNLNIDERKYHKWNLNLAKLQTLSAHHSAIGIQLLYSILNKSKDLKGISLRAISHKNWKLGSSFERLFTYDAGYYFEYIKPFLESAHHPKLKHVDLQDCITGFDAPAWAAIANNAPNLTSLNLTDSNKEYSYCTDHTTPMDRVEVVTISNNISNELLANILSPAVNLKEVHVTSVYCHFDISVISNKIILRKILNNEIKFYHIRSGDRIQLGIQDIFGDDVVNRISSIPNKPKLSSQPSDSSTSLQITQTAHTTTNSKGFTQQQRTHAGALIDSDTSKQKRDFNVDKIFFSNSKHMDPKVSSYRISVYNSIEIDNAPGTNRPFIIRNGGQLELVNVKKDIKIIGKDTRHLLIAIQQRNSNTPMYYGRVKLEASNKWAPLPCLGAQDKIHILNVEGVGAHCIEIHYSRRDNLYYIKNNINNNQIYHVNYILSNPQTKIKQLPKKLQDKIFKYQNPSSELLDLSNRKNLTGQEFAEEIIKQNKTVPCRHRAATFIYDLEKENEFICRFIANDCHAYVEIYHKGQWVKANLGGVPGNLNIHEPEPPKLEEIEEKQAELTPEVLDAILPEISLAPAVEKPGMLMVPPSEDVIKQHKSTLKDAGVEIETISDFTPSIITEDSLNPLFKVWDNKKESFESIVEYQQSILQDVGLNKLVTLNKLCTQQIALLLQQYCLKTHVRAPLGHRG